MKIEFLKERYDFELKRSDQLTSELPLPVGVLSGLGGLMAAMVRSFPHKTLWLTVPFGVAFALDVVGFFTASSTWLACTTARSICICRF